MDKMLALKMFVETVRSAGFSAAARRLGIATSSVTRMVTALESELGAVLLNRNTRNVSVTEAGERYYAHAVAILKAIEEADAAITDRGSEARGRLSASVPVEFGRRVIAPRLGRLLDRHPALEISLILSDEIIDLLGERADVAVRLGTSMLNDDVVSLRIGEFRRWVVASPEYLAGRDRLVHPEQLVEHDCLTFAYTTTEPHWSFRKGDERIRVDVRGRLRSNNADILREAALAGRGVALLSDWLVGEDVGKGLLRHLLADYEATPGNLSSAINVLYLPNHRGSRRVGAFIEFLREIIGEPG